MAVIINEFEIAATEPSGTAAQPAPEAAPAPAPSPMDIADVIRRRAERMARVEAH